MRPLFFPTKQEAAEKAAKELLQAEEREKEGKKAFKDGSMKKGFLDGKKWTNCFWEVHS